MAQQLRTTIKGYFQTGNIPVEQHYVDFIDSTLNLNEGNTGNIDLTGNITASGNISSSGASGNHILGGDLFVTNDISASRNISCSGAFTGSGINILGNITASGNMKCGELDIGGQLSATNVDFTYISGSKITTDGAIACTTLNTGQGDNELYDMDQNVKTTSAVTFATVNTGQGANELFGMNQNVATDSTVTFAGITLGKPSRSGGNFGSTINVEGQSFFMTIANIPVLPGKGEEIASKKSTIPTLIQNTSCLTTSVILVTCASALLSVTAFRVTEGSFQISISNESISAFEEGSAIFNFTIF